MPVANSKLLGDGWRQAGVIAAPGILALTEMTQRLDVDHGNAAYLAEQLAQAPGIDVEREDVHINMGWFALPEGVDMPRLMEAMEAAGIRANGSYGGKMRLVTHWQIDREAIDRAVSVIRSVVVG
jgi:threonine aldolase